MMLGEPVAHTLRHPLHHPRHAVAVPEDMPGKQTWQWPVAHRPTSSRHSERQAERRAFGVSLISFSTVRNSDEFLAYLNQNYEHWSLIPSCEYGCEIGVGSKVSSGSLTVLESQLH